MLRGLHDTDCYGDTINTDIMNKRKLSETSWPLLVKIRKAGVDKYLLYLIPPPPKRVYKQVMEYSCMDVVCMK